MKVQLHQYADLWIDLNVLVDGLILKLCNG